MLYDLHLHSYFSDGECGFDNIMNRALNLGMKGLSITDHNGIRPEIKRFGVKTEKYGIEVLEGAEISTQIYLNSEDKLSLHILSYSINLNTKRLNDGLYETIVGYEKRARIIIKKCQNLGIRINYDKLRGLSKEFYISRNTIAKEIVNQKKINFDQALKIAFVQDKEDWFLDPEQAISLIKESDGVPILAHPGKLIHKLSMKYSTKDSTSILERLLMAGLQGIEVYHPNHTPREINTLLKIAKKYSLLITGGSDYHGPHRPPYTEIGNAGINQVRFRKLKKAAQETYNASHPLWSKNYQYSPSF